MWNLFNCYLSGRHEFGVWCEPGAIFLRCVHCGRRSSGWELQGQKPQMTAQLPAHASAMVKMTVPSAAAQAGRVLPFDRAAS
jgi:hypothetical protein